MKKKRTKSTKEKLLGAGMASKAGTQIETHQERMQKRMQEITGKKPKRWGQ